MKHFKISQALIPLSVQRTIVPWRIIASFPTLNQAFKNHDSLTPSRSVQVTIAHFRFIFLSYLLAFPCFLFSRAIIHELQIYLRTSKNPQIVDITLAYFCILIYLYREIRNVAINPRFMSPVWRVRYVDLRKY